MATRRSSVVRARPRDPVPLARGERMRLLLKKLPLGGVPWAVLLGLGVCGVFFWQWVSNTAYFNATEWIVFGTERLTEEEILRMAGAPEDEYDFVHLLHYDPAGAEKNLDEHPVVHHADVIRRFPQTVEIQVIEREAAAVLIAGEASLLMDWEGVTFAAAGPEELLDPEMPIITATLPRVPEAGGALPEEMAHAVLEYSETLRNLRGTLTADAVSEIHWEPEMGVSLVMRGGARLLCGMKPPEETLPRAEAFAEKHRGFQGVDYADLRLDSHVPWMPAGESVIQARR